MALRQSTIDNSLNRHRFVTEAAALPYLRNRERANARRALREAMRALDEARRASTYGTGNLLTMAQRIALIAQHIERCAATLRDLPTIAEMKVAAARRERLAQWRATQMPETTATDRLAAD